ncbi:MAG: hypothetical protein IJW28_01415 [Clostridia bacterium]|nr:hypothetical protein [Clostridia bacterium]
MAYDSYIFDKRKVKKAITKFIIACVCSFPFLLALNIFTTNTFDFWVTVVLDSIILLVIYFIVSSIYDKAVARSEARRARRRGERMAMQERKEEILKESKRKQEIMQDNYKRIREEKKRAKEKKLQESNKTDDADVEVIVPDTKEEK